MAVGLSLLCLLCYTSSADYWISEEELTELEAIMERQSTTIATLRQELSIASQELTEARTLLTEARQLLSGALGSLDQQAVTLTELRNSFAESVRAAKVEVWLWRGVTAACIVAAVVLALR